MRFCRRGVAHAVSLSSRSGQLPAGSRRDPGWPVARRTVEFVYDHDPDDAGER
jgi:hypothetical protein